VEATVESIEEAKIFCREKMRDSGGTDIHSALLKGLDLILKGNALSATRSVLLIEAPLQHSANRVRKCSKEPHSHWTNVLKF
jgi:hypothetical protein